MHFSCIYGNDKDGRVVCYQRCANFLPVNSSIETVERYVLYFMDFASTKCKPNCDGMVVVVDLNNAGYQNLYRDHVMAVLTLCTEHYISRAEKILILNSSWTTRTIYAGLKKFLSVRS